MEVNERISTGRLFQTLGAPKAKLQPNYFTDLWVVGENLSNRCRETIDHRFTPTSIHWNLTLWPKTCREDINKLQIAWKGNGSVTVFFIAHFTHAISIISNKMKRIVFGSSYLWQLRHHSTVLMALTLWGSYWFIIYLMFVDNRQISSIMNLSVKLEGFEADYNTSSGKCCVLTLFVVVS